MDSSTNDSSFENESHDETSPKSALSTSFTISFEDESESTLKQKKIKATNMFVRRHIRTLSLPVENCISNKVTSQSTSTMVGKVDCISTNQINGTVSDVKMTKESCIKENLESTESDDCLEKNGNGQKDSASDSDSEGGTYTLDKDNKEVLRARKTIDQVFGISSPEHVNGNTPSNEEKLANKSRMIGEWLNQSTSLIKSTTMRPAITTTVSLMHKNHVSKIPSPVFGRRELIPKSAAKPTSNKLLVSQKSNGNDGRPDAVELKIVEQLVNSPVNGDIDTVSYLKETENIVAALHNRLQNDVKLSNETGKESPISNTRFNRAFSLRRDRLKKPAPAVISNTAIPIRAKSCQKSVTLNNRATHSNGYSSPSTNARTVASKDIKLNRSLHTASSKTLKSDDNIKKKSSSQRLKPTENGFRSTSSLSAQEIEFQNWKRRKSYDPLKAAAEDKKKKSMMQSSAGSASVSTAALTKKQKAANQNEDEETTEKGITRSASFHGLRHKNGYERFMFPGANNINHSKNNHFISSSCLSNKTSTSNRVLLNDDDDDWAVPKPPSTSLQNTPPESISSKLSLLSNAMSNSSLMLSSSANTKVNLMTLLSVTQLTREIQNTVLSLTDSLTGCSENAGDSSDKYRNENSEIFEYRTETNVGIVNEDEESTHYLDDTSDEDENKTHDLDNDDSESCDLSGNYHLNIALNNLKQIQDAVQKLQVVCANK